MGLVVVSLFNGMNTGRQALENCGYKVDKYYSSELKPTAIRLTQHHFPDTIQLGDVLKWREWDIDWASVNLVLSGSPCQDLSVAGNRSGINGTKSKLFWTFIEILNHIKSLNPNVLFLQENVGGASKKDVGIMSRAMGVYPCRINSSLLTAQLRDRYYWSNIRTKQTMFDIVTDIPQPKDKGIMFKDILTDGYTDRDKAQTLLQSEAKTFGYSDNEKFSKFIAKRQYEKRQVCNVVYLEKYKELVILEGDKLKVKTNTTDGYQYATENDCINMSFPSSLTRGKAPCLLQSDEPLFAFTGDNIRPLNKTELCRLQGFDGSYCDILSRNQAASLLGDGWTLPVIEWIFSFMTSTEKTT